jgi:serine/threonine-protein kinase
MAQPSKERFGRYELVSKLGRGGMAETWRARLIGEAGVTKPVLIKKVLTEYASDEAFVSMFISEARISASLSHGNIAQVFDFGRTEGEYFLAMELVDGQPLHRVIKRALKAGLPGIPVPLAVFIALEMCRGLHYAHTRRDESGAALGIVHRDISPDNVLVSYEGQIKIVDFGIAKTRALRGFNTEPGVVKGKYLFFSPEQARGEEVDARTDVWATGIVLYEMLCGQLPVSGQQHAALPRLMKGEFPRPRQLRPSLSAELDDLVMRALAVNPEERYPSCHAFGDALAGFLYSAAPRFSGMSVAYLLQELFRAELTAEGRDVQIPRTFQEELSAWRVPESLLAVAPEVETETRPARAVKTPDSRTLVNTALGVCGLLLCVAVGALVTSPEPAAPPAHVTEPRPIVPAPKEKPPAAVASAQAQPAPAPSAPTVAPAQPPPEALGPRSATYPVDSIRLEARRDLFQVSPRFSAIARLDVDERYLLNEPAARPEDSPLFFLLMGDGLKADESVGTLTTQPRRVQRARAALFFTVGPMETHTKDMRTVEVLNERTGHIYSVTVQPSHARTSLERAFELKGLEGAVTYQLALGSGGPGAYTHGPQKGTVRKVACARKTSEGPIRGRRLDGFSHGQQFLVVEGAPVEVRGASALWCGFIDDVDPRDNQGELELHIKPLERAGGLETQGPGGDRKVVRELQEYGKALLRQGRLREAQSVLEDCFAVDPSYADCYATMGGVSIRLGRPGEGARYYREFLRLAPNDEKAPVVRRILADFDRRRR